MSPQKMKIQKQYSDVMPQDEFVPCTQTKIENVLAQTMQQTLDQCKETSEELVKSMLQDNFYQIGVDTISEKSATLVDYEKGQFGIVKDRNYIFVGQVEDKVPRGVGRMISRVTGSVYDGQVEDYKKHGYGRIQYGICEEYHMQGIESYLGFFENNVRHGEGTLYFKDGTEKTGDWDAGEFQAFDEYDSEDEARKELQMKRLEEKQFVPLTQE